MADLNKWKAYREGMVATDSDKNPYPPGSASFKRWVAGKEFGQINGHKVEMVVTDEADESDAEFAALFQYKEPAKKKRKTGKKQNKTPAIDLEKAVQKECIKTLSKFGILQWRNNVGQMQMGKRRVSFGSTGQPDLMGILPDGKFIGVECKRRYGGVVSEKQKLWGTKIKQWHGLWTVVHSGAELSMYLKRKGYEHV